MILKSTKNVSSSYLLQLKLYHSSYRIYETLSEMFQNQLFVMKLSQKTRILPNYFSPSSLKQFKNSSGMSQYLTHTIKQKYKPSQQSFSTQSIAHSIFQTFPKYKYNITSLDCYIDWLTSIKLQKHSNQYYKNKCAMEMFDMRNPQNWFFGIKNRQFIYHHGPTNSGKTSSAIKQLKQLPKDKKGIYMAPLRLLAWEMQQKLQNCNLITGQDKQYRVSNLTSCTIQASSCSDQFDVAIIDQIQMIGDIQRGWSWTRAILSTKAKRIHLCGDQRAIGLISKLIKQCGGTLEQRRYSRLGKLKLIPQIFEIKNIQEGDCMIQFSVQTLHKLRKRIKDQLTKRQNSKSPQNQHVQQNYQQKSSPIAMVYGRLPPQCRKQEAHKFNARAAPYLVATNAIGMGLNLNIKKIIFASIKRRSFKGGQVELQEHEIQQIAGRAGRGLNDGLVQCMSYEILRKVRKALRNVNKTYGINLQDDQSSQQAKQLLGDDDDLLETSKKSNNQEDNLQNYDAYLKRVLTQKQRSIEKAGLFVEYVFLKRMMMFMTQYYGRNISLGQSVKLHLNLSLKSDDLYFMSQKAQLVEWINKLQKEHKFEARDTFEIAKGLSMHYNSYYAKQKMAYFADRFEQKRIVNIPKKNIQSRNNKKVNNNFARLDILQSNYSVLQVYINLWNRYEFIFWDIEQAKRLKQQTSRLIKSVLSDEDGFYFNKQRRQKSNNNTSQLVQQQRMDQQRQNRKQTILDEQTSDIQKIKLR